MKALTVKQPWANLIMYGLKDVENRTRRTHCRGRIAIHVALQPSKPGGHLDDLEHMNLPYRTRSIATDALRPHLANAGFVIGTVNLVDCVRDSPSQWAFEDHWHWVLENPEWIEPQPAKGALGLWEWDGQTH